MNIRVNQMYEYGLYGRVNQKVSVKLTDAAVSLFPESTTKKAAFKQKKGHIVAIWPF
jgi:hypothetical protein